MIIHTLSPNQWIVQIDNFRHRVTHGKVIQHNATLTLFFDETQPFAFQPTPKKDLRNEVHMLPQSDSKTPAPSEKAISGSNHSRKIAIWAALATCALTVLSLGKSEAQAPEIRNLNTEILQHKHFLYLAEKDFSTQLQAQTTPQEAANTQKSKHTQKLSTKNPHKVRKKTPKYRPQLKNEDASFRRFLPQEKK
jgi:hypothetical protein